MIKNKKNIIKKIFKSIKDISDIQKKKEISWDARVMTSYKVFRALDKYRFRLKPANIEECLNTLVDSKNFLEKIIIQKEEKYLSSPNIDEPIEKSRRMQYLYGLAWSQQSDQEYDDGSSHFEGRLKNCNIDSSFLKGADCLDLGVGHARYAMAFIKLGAKGVTGIDFSKECLEEAKRRLKYFPKEGKKIKLYNYDIYKLPDTMMDSFDFVCANGFIHHLQDPTKALQIVYKTMKRGGLAFTFVFAEDGTPRWRVIDLMRDFLKHVPIWYSHKLLKAFEVPGNKIFNFLDYSYTPIQHRFNRKEFENTLKNIGFRSIKFLDGGIIHDSVFRSKLFDEDRFLYGDSEIRYIMKK